jgi:hypothetical protein
MFFLLDLVSNGLDIFCYVLLLLVELVSFLLLVFLFLLKDVTNFDLFVDFIPGLLQLVMHSNYFDMKIFGAFSIMFGRILNLELHFLKLFLLF